MYLGLCIKSRMTTNTSWIPAIALKDIKGAGMTKMDSASSAK